MSSKKPAVIPTPQRIQWMEGLADFSSRAPWVKSFIPDRVNDELTFASEALARVIYEAGGLMAQVETVPGIPGEDVLMPGVVALALREIGGEFGDEGYRLTVGDGALIEARKPAGLFYGAQTFRQLLRLADGRLAAPKCVVEDWPEWGWRGTMLDQGRNFQTMGFLKKQIDVASFYKMNVFHMHLTEFPGWRLESKAFPNLASDDKYTQDEMRELVAYAEARFVNIMPEIEMPGHSTAFLKKMPHLKCTNNTMCMGNDELYETLETILAEVADVFPSPYLHIGTDECAGGKDCPRCAAKWAEISKQPDHPPTLMAYFISRMNDVVNKLGRTTVLWNDQLENGLPKNVIIHSWRNDSSAVEVARAGYKTINSHCPEVYLDNLLVQEWLPRAYRWSPNDNEPLPIENILGGQAEAWHDPPVDHEDQILDDLAYYPKTITVAERLWRGSSGRSIPFETFQAALAEHKERFFAGDIFPFPEVTEHWHKRYEGKWPPPPEQGLTIETSI